MNGLRVSSKEPLVLLEVPVEYLRSKMEEVGEEGVVFLGEREEAERKELLEDLNCKVEDLEEVLFL